MELRMYRVPLQIQNGEFSQIVDTFFAILNQLKLVKLDFYSPRGGG